MAPRKHDDEQPDVSTTGELVPVAPGAVGPVASEPPPPNDPESLNVDESLVAEYIGPRSSDGLPLYYATGIPAGPIRADTWAALSEEQRDLVSDLKDGDGKPLFRVASAQQRERDQRRARREASQQVKQLNS